MKEMHVLRIRFGPMFYMTCVYMDGRVDDTYDLVSFISVGVGGLVSLPAGHIDAFMNVLYIAKCGWLVGWSVDTRYCGYI